MFSDGVMPVVELVPKAVIACGEGDVDFVASAFLAVGDEVVREIWEKGFVAAVASGSRECIEFLLGEGERLGIPISEKVFSMLSLGFPDVSLGLVSSVDKDVLGSGFSAVCIQGNADSVYRFGEVVLGVSEELFSSSFEMANEMGVWKSVDVLLDFPVAASVLKRGFSIALASLRETDEAVAVLRRYLEIGGADLLLSGGDGCSPLSPLGRCAAGRKSRFFDELLSFVSCYDEDVLREVEGVDSSGEMFARLRSKMEVLSLSAGGFSGGNRYGGRGL